MADQEPHPCIHLDSIERDTAHAVSAIGQIPRHYELAARTDHDAAHEAIRTCLAGLTAAIDDAYRQVSQIAAGQNVA